MHVARKAKEMQLDRAFTLAVRHCHREIGVGTSLHSSEMAAVLEGPTLSDVTFGIEGTLFTAH